MSNLMILQVSSVQVDNLIISLFIGQPRLDSTYRQKVQKLNDEKYRIQHETAQQTEVSSFDIYPVVTNYGTS